LRHIVLENDHVYYAAPDEMDVLEYYANSISHFIKPKSQK
jgi:hypothetical protein